MTLSGHPTRHVAIDLGAESGRVMVGKFDGERVSLLEAHRFPNTPLRIGDELHWNFRDIVDQVLAGIRRAMARGQPASIGIDGWGCDYALFQDDGALLGTPFHYRDGRTTGIPEDVFERIPEAEIYAITGSQTIRFNTLFQLIGDKESGSLDYASTVRLIPDALTFWLCGDDASEATIASTTQLFDPVSRDWAWALIDRLDLPRHLFAPVDEPGTRRGNVWRDIELDTGITSDPEVISVASHDTASAVAAMAMDDNTMFISSGTWSLAGIEVDEPLISDEARLANFTNEAWIRNTTRFLRNGTGFWLLQECRRIWNTRGYPYDYDELIALARTAPPLRSMIDPDHPDFLLPDDMPAAILDFCGRTGQPQPDDHGAVIRVALESMALNYRHILTDVERLSGRHITRIHIAGGGSKNPLHCQFTADATGRMVVAGPSEATALGNVMVQARSLNLVDSLGDIREVIERSFETPIYEPRADRDQWDEAYQRYVELKSMSQI